MIFDYSSVTADSVSEVVDSTIAHGESLIDDLLAVDGPRTLDNTLLPLEEVGRSVAVAFGRGPFLGRVATDDATRGRGPRGGGTDPEVDPGSGVPP